MLDKITWFRVGGPAEVLFKPADVDDLCLFLKEKPKDIPVSTIGVGSNLLVRDGGVPGVVIRLGKGFSNIVITGDMVDVGAAVLDRNVALSCRDEGLTGLEFLCGVPGTIGGALRMNAGCYGSEVKDALISVVAVDSVGAIHRLTPEECRFSYRHCGIPAGWIFIGARFNVTSSSVEEVDQRIQKMLSEREGTQPVKSRTGGSTFANPEGLKAWELIDQAGCRGLKVGQAQMSPMHCNFMINTGNASAFDLESLGELVRERVLKHSGVELEWEIQRLGIQSNEVKPRVRAA